MNLLRKYYDGLADWPSGGQTDKPTGEELNCMVCGKEFIGEEPKMCCSGRECGCMGLPIDPIVCSKECYDKLPLPSSPLTPIYDNIVEVMNEAENNKPTGVPEDVIAKAQENEIIKSWMEFGSHNAESSDMVKVFCDGYSLALPELTAKEEEIAKLKEEVERLKEESAGHELDFFVTSDELSAANQIIEYRDIEIDRLTAEIERLNNKTL